MKNKIFSDGNRLYLAITVLVIARLGLVEPCGPSPWHTRSGTVQVLLKKTALADTCGFTTKFAQIVQAGAANTTECDDLYLLDSRRMKSKGFFYSDTVGNLPDCEGGVHGAPFTLDNHALKNLYPLFVALDNPDMNLDSVARTKLGDIETHLLQIDFVQ